jgi:hypothetical protein
VTRRLRGSRLTALVAALVLAAGALVSASDVLAAPAPAGPQAVHAHLAYRCRFPGGPGPAGVTLAGTLPATVPAGQPIQISGLHTTVTFPRSAVARLRKLGATSVTAHDVLTAAVADNANAVTALWPGQARKPVPVPTTDRLHLTFSGPATPVRASKPGTVTFTASGLSLALALRNARATQANQPVQTATCTLVPGQDTKLGTVAVTPAPARLSRPGGGRHAKGRAPLSAGIPKGCGKRFIHGGIKNPLLGCAYLIGYADVHKLKEAALIGPAVNGSAPAALLNVDTYGTDTSKVHGTLQLFNCTAAKLDYHQRLEFPPARTTFLTFGFAPVSAILHLAEVKWPHKPVENPRCYKGLLGNSKPVHLTSPLVSVFTDTNTNVNKGEPVLNTGTTYLSIRVTQVAINGVPLNVGSNCGVPGPVRAVLVGRGIDVPRPEGYTLAGGGPLTGSVTIPNFTHCGVGENLDPLLSAAISGPANFQLITQGVLCVPAEGHHGCPPRAPKPLRHIKKLKG